MLLGALGYDSAQEGFTNEGWTRNMLRIGETAGLYRGVELDGNTPIDRETACQLALNALKAFTVDYRPVQ